jgi:hypothetical protein
VAKTERATDTNWSRRWSRGNLCCGLDILQCYAKTSL